MYAFIIVPRPLRDVAYRFIARYRSRWFGLREACMTPEFNIRARFLDDEHIAIGPARSRPLQKQPPPEPAHPEAARAGCGDDSRRRSAPGRS
jgi:hypothetical protein